MKNQFSEAQQAEMLDRHTLLLTRSGSRLYNLQNENSDEDFYRVLSDEYFTEMYGNSSRKSQARQTIIGNRDEMFLSFNTYAMFLFDYAPQALETLFATNTPEHPDLILLDRMGDYRAAFRTGFNARLLDRYRRTITSFAHGSARTKGQSDEKFFYANMKRRRHALRLTANLMSMEEQWSFDPYLTTEQADNFTRLATSNPEEYLSGLMSMTPYLDREDFNLEEIATRFPG